MSAASGSASPLHNVAIWTQRRAEIGGDRLAVVDTDRRLDYAAFEDRIARCAGVLAHLGVRREDRVALLLGNRSAYLEVVLAAARIGAIAVPINARLTAPEVTRILDDCAPRLLVHDAATTGVAAASCARTRATPATLACPEAYEAALSACAERPPILAVTPDAPMMLMYTSGTTGTPKGALLPHRKAFYNSLNARIFFDLTADDRVLVVLPLFHSFGLCILSLPALYAGAAVLLEPRFDAEHTWRRVAEERATCMGGVPTQLRALREALEDGAHAYDVSSLRFVFGAGAAVPVEEILAFERRGIVLKQGFGQTETSILCCLDARDAVRKAGSVGRPVFHAEVRVVARDSLAAPPERWRTVEVGEKGEIVVRGPITMLGYWNQPDATAETLRGAWLRTGDLATVDPEGFVTLVGRARDMYISGGENVYPAEVEAVYAEHSAVAEIAVVGVPDPRWGECGRAFVVPRDGARVDPDALRRWGAERLASFKLPREFVAVESLPRTETGKVQKHRLAKESSCIGLTADRGSEKPEP